MDARMKIRLGRVALALGALAAVGVFASGLGTSTNYTIDEEVMPVVAENAYSPNYRMIGAMPDQPSGAVGISAQYRMHFDSLTPESFLPDDLVPPVITAGPTVTYISDTIALIEWETDELSDGVVHFGITPAFGSTASHSGFATLHQVVISTGLSPNTFYFFEARSTDPYFNGPTASTLLDFTTANSADTVGPLITPTVTILATTVAQLDFTTDEMVQTEIHHGPTAGLGTTEADPTWVTSRSRTFTGLTAGGIYYYAIDATDPSGNPSAVAATAINLPADVSIVTTTLPNGRKDSAYLQNIIATGGVGTLTFTLTSGVLPLGLTLAADGTLSGTPTENGTFTFDVEVTDAGTPASVDTVSLTLVINKKKSSGGGEEETCTTGGNSQGWPALLAAALMLLLATRLVRRAV